MTTRRSGPAADRRHRSRKRLEALGVDLVTDDVRRLEPFGFHDYNHLQLARACVLCDSGTMSEEASILSFPAVTLRDSIERPDPLGSESITMTGLSPDHVETAIAIDDGAVTSSSVASYEVRDTSNPVVRLLVSTGSRHHAWAGVRR